MANEIIFILKSSANDLELKKNFSAIGDTDIYYYDEKNGFFVRRLSENFKKQLNARFQLFSVVQLQ